MKTEEELKKLEEELLDWINLDLDARQEISWSGMIMMLRYVLDDKEAFNEVNKLRAGMQRYKRTKEMVDKTKASNN